MNPKAAADIDFCEVCLEKLPCSCVPLDPITEIAEKSIGDVCKENGINPYSPFGLKLQKSVTRALHEAYELGRQDYKREHWPNA